MSDYCEIERLFMAAHMILSGMWLQDAGSLSSGNSRMLMVFVGMVAVALIVQAIALIVMAVGAAKARKHGLEMAEEIKAKILPVIDAAQSMLRDAAPKIKVITENLVETSHVVRSKAQERLGRSWDRSNMRCGCRCARWRAW
jgi:hypothetical protein